MKKGPAKETKHYRADEHPEDNGCKYYPKCSECPYPACLIAEASGRLWLARSKWHIAMILHEQGKDNKEIARILAFKPYEVDEYFEKVFKEKK